MSQARGTLFLQGPAHHYIESNHIFSLFLKKSSVPRHQGARKSLLVFLNVFVSCCRNCSVQIVLTNTRSLDSSRDDIHPVPEWHD